MPRAHSTCSRAGPKASFARARRSWASRYSRPEGQSGAGRGLGDSGSGRPSCLFPNPQQYAAAARIFQQLLPLDGFRGDAALQLQKCQIQHSLVSQEG